jgi:hypothetical protein
MPRISSEGQNQRIFLMTAVFQRGVAAMASPLYIMAIPEIYATSMQSQ